ncbi:rhomboid family intramembrane serine protease [Marinobacter bryozoorum]|uniref:rhomboid family intramembrane serine protease n=1 Tax=Marinobacter bryozoorum TaxID=256324 RepID=UPI002003E398|nr:rhomboid family intramembrane serine protease [Marinobacter bryozoorum]MCK7542643.1 rhomboid family intramembrane serine protease [Marinobacter bryozoorum]
MIILPAERKLDWKNPPWMTLALMLACLLVFLFYQAKDPRLMGQAISTYLDANLDELELPLYLDYLERQQLRGESGAQERLDYLRLLQRGGERVGLAAGILSDRAFMAYLVDNRELVMNSAERAYWAEHRAPIQERFINRLSANEAGLIPAEPSLYRFITYQFLHGGWGHLVGNLVFLFLLGYTVEKALGPGRYLLAYLLCGVVAGAVHGLFHWNEPVALVGASGSISGLMGMYVAFYGLQRIRFFYFLGVYFNYFRAPALVILPVWLAKEIYDYVMAGATGVAYLAHAGGLLAGAALVLLLGKGWFQAREAFYEPEQDDQDEAFSADYARALEAVARMDFGTARKRFEALWQANPERPVALEHLYLLARLRPDLPDYRERTVELLHTYLRLQQTENLVKTWQEYLDLAESHQPLDPEEHNRVLFAALRGDDLGVAERAFARLRESGSQEQVREAGQLLAAEFGKRQMASRANEYRELVRSL